MVSENPKTPGKQYVDETGVNATKPCSATNWKEEARGTGLPVFPIKIFWCDYEQKNKKVPLTPNGHLDAAVGDGVDAQSNWCAATGYGVAMGDGLYAFDEDTYKSDSEAEQWMKDHGLDVPTRTHGTVSGGRHRLFTTPDGWDGLPSGGGIVHGLDTRGKGGWIAFGEGYSVLDDTDPVELPESVCQALWDRAQSRKVARSGGDIPMAVLDAQLETSVQEAILKNLPLRTALMNKTKDGNATLVNVAGECQRQEMTKKQFSEVVMAAGRSSAHAHVLKEENRGGATSGARALGRAWDYAEGTPFKACGDQDFNVIEMGDAEWDRQEAARAANRDHLLPDFDDLPKCDAEEFDYIFGGQPESEGAKTTNFDPLRDTPGLVGDIMRWTYATSIRDEPAPGVAAGLAAVSIAIGTAFKFDLADTEYGNISVNLVMPTGAGKGEVSRTLRLTTAVVSVRHLYQNFRSQPAMHNAFLAVQGALLDARVLLVNDELGRHLQALRKGGDTNKTEVQTQIVEVFQDYYIPAQPLAKDPRDEVHPAFLVPIGMTQPSVLAGGLPDDSLADGSVTRPLWFFGEFKPKRKPSGLPRNVLPQNIVDSLVWLYEQYSAIRLAFEMEPNVPNGLPVPEITLRVKPDAAAVLEAYDAECEAEALKAATKNDGATVAVLSRAFQNCQRVALVIAAGEAAGAGGTTLDMADITRPTIPLTEAAANAAVGLMRQSSDGLAKYARENIGVSLGAQIEQRVLRVMGKALKAGQPALKHKVLVDRCRSSDKEGRTKVTGLQARRAIEDLLDRGWLEEGNLDKAKAYKLSPRGRKELQRWG